MQDNQITVDRWYMAQIAAEIRRSFSTNSAAVAIKQFFHKLTKPKGFKTQGKPEISRSIWLGAFGIKAPKDKK